MSKIFQELQSKHIVLISKYEIDKTSDDLLEKVNEFIAFIRLSSKQIIDQKERSQLGEILRFWGAFVYDRTNTYPETILLPAEKTPWIRRRLIAGAGFIILTLLSFYSFYLYSISHRPDISSPDIQTAVVASLTATVWTPMPITPTATPEPNTGRIVDILNGVMLGADPLAEAIVAKFSVLDAKFTSSPPLYLIDILSIHVECESNYNISCAPEEAFLALMHAFTATDKIIGKVSEQVPATVLIMQVVTYNRMVQSGMILVNWSDVVDYATGNINGGQLGSRITRLPPP